MIARIYIGDAGRTHPVQVNPWGRTRPRGMVKADNPLPLDKATANLPLLGN